MDKASNSAEMKTADAENAPNAADTYSLMPVLLPLVQAKWLLVGVPFVVSFCVLLHGLFSTPYYKASTRVLPPQYNQNTISRGLIAMGGESALGNSALNLKNPTDRKSVV